VDRVGDQLLAGAVLALDEAVGVARRDAPHHLEQIVDPAAAADDARDLRGPRELLAQLLVLGLQVAAFDGLVEHGNERVRLDRLLDEAVGARPDRLDGVRDAAVPGEHDHLRPFMELTEAPQELDPVHVRQQQVGDDNVGAPGLEHFFAARAGRSRTHLVPLLLEQGLQPLQHRKFVVYREYAGFVQARHRIPQSGCVRSEIEQFDNRLSIFRHENGFYTLTAPASY
jgi:hypothetical protein